MADIFSSENVQDVLANKEVWFFGDSNVRGTYKDFVWLIQKNSLISTENLKKKLETTFLNDRLLKGQALDRGRNYQEVRRYENFKLGTALEFMFLTKCLNADLENKLKFMQKAPDLIVMNSCLWDIARWGPDGVLNYKKNLNTLMKLLKSTLPPTTLVIWTTTPPVSDEPYGGFLIKQIEFMKHTIRFDVMEANIFARQEAVSHGFDVLDIHFHLLLQIHRRRPDGIHWDRDAVRYVTNLILTHVALSWGKPLPGNFVSPVIRKVKSFVPEPIVKEPEQKLHELDHLLNVLERPIPPESKSKSIVAVKAKKRSRPIKPKRTMGKRKSRRSDMRIWQQDEWNVRRIEVWENARLFEQQNRYNGNFSVNFNNLQPINESYKHSFNIFNQMLNNNYNNNNSHACPQPWRPFTQGNERNNHGPPSLPSLNWGNDNINFHNYRPY